MPQLRPFRALRYALDAVDPAAVVSPPYDVVTAEDHARLLDRHPANVIRLELPEREPDDEGDERYRRAARTFAAWRSDGTLRKDVRPSVYVYEQAYLVPGSGERLAQRGFFARLRLEPLGPAGGVLPHERTLAAPKEDRYKLLRATGANLSPVVVLADDPEGSTDAILADVATRPADVDLTDDEGTRHRLWVVAAAGTPDGEAERLCHLAGRAPLTIADGHHRYETALRYRDERRMTRSCEEDPPFDHLLVLVVATAATPPTVLPTHRLVRGLGDAGVRSLLDGLSALFEVEEMPAEAVLEALRTRPAPERGGRFGLVTRDGSAFLQARPEALEPLLPPASPALRALDVTVLGAALERLCGIDEAAVATGDRVAYTRSADEAADLVRAGTDGIDAALLLDPTPVRAVVAVARAGETMPQKSTFFYPKALTGLVINPHET